jgi:diguanylate cyclase (GGDEF)-like protein/PAS domain S-box-containing protein
MSSVLLVEDNEVNRAMLTRRLERRGFTVHVAVNGRDALDAAERLKPDVVLMDLSLPELDGIEATRRLKANPATAGLPVIALTTHALATAREEALAAGCVDLDSKPVNLNRLLEKIGRCLQGAPLARAATAEARPDGVLLLVDGDADGRDMLSRRLERSGFRVLQAASGSEALAVLMLEDVDLVLLDMTVPDVGGLEVLRQIRATHAPSELPVVMATASDRSEHMVAALEAGASDYVTRPIDFVVTLARVRTHLKASRAERALRVSEERYALAALGSNDGLFDWDLQTDRVCYSERWASLLGIDHARLIPHFSEWMSRIHVEEQARVAQELRAHIDGLIPSWESEHRVRHADGHYRWVLARGMARRDDNGRPVRLAGSLSDVTHAKVADPLTGLPNRLLFLERMHHALSAPREDDAPRFAVIFMDLDGFKLVNDSLGHVAGDDLLVQVARRLEAGVRRSDFTGHLSLRRTLSRLGGDEFAILLEDIHDEATALAVAERLQAAVREPFLLDGRPAHCTLSIGIVLDDPRYAFGEELMRDADAAMYRAKKRGRGQSEVFTEAVFAEAQLRLRLESDLRDAIARDEITPYYQPIVTLEDGTLEGFEALVRWRHAERGLLGPDKFLHMAEEAGIIGPLTYAVFERAAVDLRAWREAWPGAARLTMSVNIAPRLFTDPALVDRLLGILATHGLTPDVFKLEIVEATLLDAAPPVAERLRALRSAGFALVLDDFGTGYSALSYLHAFPLSTLKIDRTFINRMGDVRDDAVQMVRSIVALAHGLGMDVTAEGIETQAQVRWLQALTCVRGQGFFFERALAPESIGQVLDEPHFIVPDVMPADDVPLGAR